MRARVAQVDGRGAGVAGRPRSVAIGALLLALLGAPVAGWAQRAPTLHALEVEAQGLEGRVDFVLKHFGRESATAGLDELERRFSEAEIHFLLNDYAAAVVFLYDLIETDEFRAARDYPHALYYLAESLYQLGSLVPSRNFFSMLLELGGPEQKQLALQRLIEIGGKTRDYRNIDTYVDQFKREFGGLKPEVSYAYGKFIFDRAGVDPQDRLKAAAEAFAGVPVNSQYGLRAKYFTGVLQVKVGDLAAAMTAFREVISQPTVATADRPVIELSWMAVARLHYQEQRFEEAIDAYSRLPRQSPYFYESLYEMAWAHVRRGDAESALRAAEILLVGASDSPLAPEALILMGGLYAQQRDYERSLETYNEIINTYGPVRDELDALLGLHEDPVAYFNDLIAREGERFSVNELLPPAAAKWASTQRDISQAFEIVNALQGGREDVRDGDRIADRIIAALDAGTLEPFPALAEGHQRATEVQAEVLGLQARAADLQSGLIQRHVPEGLRAQLQAAREERQAIEQAFRSLPTRAEDVAAQQSAWLAKVAEVEKQAHNLGVSAGALNAQLEGVRKWLRDAELEQQNDLAEVEAFLGRLEREKQVVDQLHAEARALLAELKDLGDGVKSGTAVAGAAELRAAYQEALARESTVRAEARARMSGDDRVQAERVEGLLGVTEGLNQRLVSYLDDLEARAARRRDAIRRQVEIERGRLVSYGGEVDGVMFETHDLVGRIAFNSFRKVQRDFAQIILEADVGLIDVAWARKQERTHAIQKLAQEKDRQLRLLDAEFEEVLKDDQ